MTRVMKERPATFIRSQRIVDTFELFRQLCDKGRYNVTQFRDFLGDLATQKEDNR